MHLTEVHQERLGNANGAVRQAGPDHGARLSAAASSRGSYMLSRDHWNVRVTLLHGMPGISTNSNPDTALPSRPHIHGGKY